MLILIFRRRFAYFCKLLLGQRHASRANISYAVRELIFGYAAKSLGVRVAEILTDTAVKMNIDKRRDYIAIISVNNRIIAAFIG